MTLRALPYRVPPESAVTAAGWRLVLGEDEIPLPEALPDWDYQMDLHLRRRVSVDLTGVRTQSGLADDTPLMLSVVWRSSGSNLSGPARHARLRVAGGTEDVNLDFRLRGADLGGLLVLDTVLVLADRRPDAPPSSPAGPDRCCGAIATDCASRETLPNSRWRSSISPTPLIRTPPPGIFRSAEAWRAPPWVRCSC